MPAVTNLKQVIAATIQALAELYKIGFVENIDFKRFTLSPERDSEHGYVIQDVTCEFPSWDSGLKIVITCSQDGSTGAWEAERAKIPFVTFTDFKYLVRRSSPVVHWTVVGNETER